MYSYDMATINSVLPAFANAKDVIVCDEVWFSQSSRALYRAGRCLTCWPDLSTPRRRVKACLRDAWLSWACGSDHALALLCTVIAPAQSARPSCWHSRPGLACWTLSQRQQIPAWQHAREGQESDTLPA